MAVFLVGINHHSADLEIREKYAFSESEYANHLDRITRLPHVKCGVALSTCNRSEYYLSLEDRADGQKLLTQIFSDQLDASHLYTANGSVCAQHLFKVTSGTDSVVVGETQIQGQVKKAYEIAQSVKPLDSALDKMFQMAFKTAKSVRSTTEIGRNPVSVAHCAVQLSEQIFGLLKNQKIFVIGAGETSELVIRYLLNHQAGSITIANRTYSKAKNLQKVFAVDAIPFEQMNRQLSSFDLIFTATSASEPILSFPMMEQALVERKMKPMVIVDLAVPRDVDPKVNDLDDVFLYTVDDLKNVIIENMNKRRSTLEDAQRIIDAEVELFTQWTQRLKYNKLLKAFRKSFMDQKQQIVDIYRTGDDTMDHKLEQLAHQLTKKMLHIPISRMRHILETGTREEIQLIAELFDLEMHL